MLHLAGIIRESIVDGPGIRFAVFAQGCPHHCPECHNEQTWSFEGGSESDPESIISEMKKNPLLKGITLSGGEPFCQAEEMALLAAEAHRAGFDVITYTGYTFEELAEKMKLENSIGKLLKETDILIDGRFLKDKKSYELKFTGSSNQRIIDVCGTLEKSKIILAEI
jgi:anaerobic ribonucleoside-triphosphate reductase activating protein